MVDGLVRGKIPQAKQNASNKFKSEIKRLEDKIDKIDGTKAFH